jgi:hypothetical protein
MTDLDFIQFGTFGRIISELIDSEYFPELLKVQTFSTIVSENKQSIMKRYKYNETFIALGDSRCSYVDNHYYRENFVDFSKNDEDVKTYPCNVQLLEVSWLFNNEEHNPWGREFLQKISNSSNKTYYKLDSMRIIIDYLYEKVRTHEILTDVFLFIFSLILFIFEVYVYTVFVSKEN